VNVCGVRMRTFCDCMCMRMCRYAGVCPQVVRTSRYPSMPPSNSVGCTLLLPTCISASAQTEHISSIGTAMAHRSHGHRAEPLPSAGAYACVMCVCTGVRVSECAYLSSTCVCVCACVCVRALLCVSVSVQVCAYISSIGVYAGVFVCVQLRSCVSVRVTVGVHV